MGSQTRLLPRGCGDRQGPDLITRSFTAARSAQRWLVSVAANWRLNLVSLDVLTTVLQDTPLKDQVTKHGEPRHAALSDCWDLIGELGFGIPSPQQWSSNLWDFLQGAYGLKDAPLMRILGFFRWLGSELWLQVGKGSSKSFESIWARVLGILKMGLID